MQEGIPVSRAAHTWGGGLLTAGATLPIRPLSRMQGSPCFADIISTVVTIRSIADSILCYPTASFSSVRERCGDFALRHRCRAKIEFVDVRSDRI